MRSKLNFSLILLLLNVTGIAYCQSLPTEPVKTVSERVQIALLDSAILYEQIKPVLFNLKVAYRLQSDENKALTNALRLSESLTEIQKSENAKVIRESKRNSRRQLIKGIGIGGLVGLAVALVSKI
jgi:hypothetical protein